MKTCQTCREIKSLDSFAVRGTINGKTDYRPHCKDCHNAGIARDRIENYSKYQNRETRTILRRPLIKIWKEMIRRTTDPKCKSYDRYGGRGITVCDEWRNSYQSFEDYVGLRPQGTTLDRINNDGSYEPGNVRWATRKEQANNKRSNVLYDYLGNAKTIRQWSEEIDINYETLKDRIKRGWTLERALTQPVQKRTIRT